MMGWLGHGSPLPRRLSQEQVHLLVSTHRLASSLYEELLCVLLHTSLHTATFPVSAWVTFSTAALTQKAMWPTQPKFKGGQRDLTYWEDSKVTEVGKMCGHVCNLPTEPRLGWIQELKQHLCFLSDPLSGWLSQWLGKLATKSSSDSAFPAQVHEDERFSQGSRS